MDVEFSVPTQRSREEEDEFQRSVKKFKESDGARSFLPPRKLVSYKDSLVGDIPGAYAQAFKFNKEWEDDYESEDEMEPLIEGMAELTSVVVWVRLPELPIEFYDAAVLREIRSIIGPVLRIDSFTASETRGGYARLCVQIDLEKPLISSIRVGRLVQKVLYEGISSLCFCCGKLGHKQDSCGLKRKEPNSENVAGVTLENNEASGEVQSDSNYGPWMVVTRKKKNQSRMGKASGPGKINIYSQVDSKGIVDISQASVRVEASEDLNKSVHCDPVDSNSETTRVGADLNMQSALKMRNDCVMEECFENSRDGCQLDSRHSPGNKRKGIVKNKGKGTESLGIRNAKTSKNHKRLPSSSEGKSGLLLLSKELGSGNQVENGEIFDRTDTTTKIRVGNLVQEPCGGHSRGDNSSDKSGANGNTGMVRGRTETGVEASVSHNTREYHVRGVEQAKEAIRDAPLGRIRLDYSGAEVGGLQRDGHGSPGKPPNSEVDPNDGSGANLRCASDLQRGHHRHFETHDHLEAKLDGIQRPAEKNGVEYGGSSSHEY
nr:hypothetical protein CFP56_03600 [Quercus suber]